MPAKRGRESLCPPARKSARVAEAHQSASRAASAAAEHSDTRGAAPPSRTQAANANVNRQPTKTTSARALLGHATRASRARTQARRIAAGILHACEPVLGAPRSNAPAAATASSSSSSISVAKSPSAKVTTSRANIKKVQEEEEEPDSPWRMLLHNDNNDNPNRIISSNNSSPSADSFSSITDLGKRRLRAIGGPSATAADAVATAQQQRRIQEQRAQKYMDSVVVSAEKVSRKPARVTSATQPLRSHPVPTANRLALVPALSGNNKDQSAIDRLHQWIRLRMPRVDSSSSPLTAPSSTSASMSAAISAREQHHHHLQQQQQDRRSRTTTTMALASSSAVREPRAPEETEQVVQGRGVTDDDDLTSQVFEDRVAAFYAKYCKDEQETKESAHMCGDSNGGGSRRGEEGRGNAKVLSQDVFRDVVASRVRRRYQTATRQSTATNTSNDARNRHVLPPSGPQAVLSSTRDSDDQVKRRPHANVVSASGESVLPRQTQTCSSETLHARDQAIANEKRSVALAGARARLVAAAAPVLPQSMATKNQEQQQKEHNQQQILNQQQLEQQHQQQQKQERPLIHRKGDTAKRGFMVDQQALPGVHYQDHHDLVEVGHGVVHQMRRKEQHHRPDVHYLSWQPELSKRMRATLFDWMHEVGREFGLCRATLHMAFYFLDRFLTKRRDVKKIDFQLVGVTVLWLASKVEEVRPPKVTSFAAATDGAYSTLELIDLEKQMVKLFEWKLSPITPFAWVDWYLRELFRIRFATSSSSSSSSAAASAKAAAVVTAGGGGCGDYESGLEYGDDSDGEPGLEFGASDDNGNGNGNDVDTRIGYEVNELKRPSTSRTADRLAEGGRRSPQQKKRRLVTGNNDKNISVQPVGSQISAGFGDSSQGSCSSHVFSRQHKTPVRGGRSGGGGMAGGNGRRLQALMQGRMRRRAQETGEDGDPHLTDPKQWCTPPQDLARPHAELQERVLQSIDLALLDIDSLTFLPSMIAATALLVHAEQFGFPSESEVEQATMYSVAELSHCREWMCDFVPFLHQNHELTIQDLDPVQYAVAEMTASTREYYQFQEQQRRRGIKTISPNRLPEMRHLNQLSAIPKAERYTLQRHNLAGLPIFKKTVGADKRMHWACVSFASLSRADWSVSTTNTMMQTPVPKSISLQQQQQQQQQRQPGLSTQQQHILPPQQQQQQKQQQHHERELSLSAATVRSATGHALQQLQHQQRLRQQQQHKQMYRLQQQQMQQDSIQQQQQVQVRRGGPQVLLPQRGERSATHHNNKQTLSHQQLSSVQHSFPSFSAQKKEEDTMHRNQRSDSDDSVHDSNAENQHERTRTRIISHSDGEYVAGSYVAENDAGTDLLEAHEELDDDDDDDVDADDDDDDDDDDDIRQFEHSIGVERDIGVGSSDMAFVDELFHDNTDRIRRAHSRSSSSGVSIEIGANGSIDVGNTDSCSGVVVDDENVPPGPVVGDAEQDMEFQQQQQQQQHHRHHGAGRVLLPMSSSRRSGVPNTTDTDVDVEEHDVGTNVDVNADVNADVHEDVDDDEDALYYGERCDEVDDGEIDYDDL